jgi:hypothetical protein
MALNPSNSTGCYSNHAQQNQYSRYAPETAGILRASGGQQHHPSRDQSDSTRDHGKSDRHVQPANGRCSLCALPLSPPA